jgi:hypothetical protein
MRFSTLPKDVQERIWRQRAEQASAIRNATRRSRAKERKRRSDFFRSIGVRNP